jgi:hypothetical protein
MSAQRKGLKMSAKRIITIQEFRDLLDLTWSHKNSCEVSDCFSDNVNRFYGIGRVISTFNGITITWSEGFEFRNGETCSLVSTTDGLEDHLVIDGAIVVDECGYALYLSRIEELLPESFVTVDYSNNPYA